MEKRQNIWVDGSLRDAGFYEQVFRRIRQTHPHYRVLAALGFAKESSTFADKDVDLPLCGC